MLKVAMLSSWHVHAGDYARQVRERADAEISLVWDENEERGRRWAQELGVPFQPNLSLAVGSPDVEGVICDAPTNMHAEVMIAAADAGKHIFTEKCMALSVAECNAISAAVRKAGVKFCISFPHRTARHNLFAKQVVEDGVIGKVTVLRVRNAHNGAIGNWLPAHFYDAVACGGGAMVDLGAHPMYLTRWLMGAPKAISTAFTSMTGRGVEDNAIATVEFEGGGVAIVETGFMTPASPNALELYGTEGSLLISGPENRVKLSSSKLDMKFEGWLDVTRLPKALPSAIDQWVRGILEDKPIVFGLEDGTQLTELMEAAYISHRESRKVFFPERR